jgi:REP element-mobilizing transposase RayT
MIVGHHLIFGAYGFWLPNDPRGSWSDFVGAWELFRYGGATKTNSRRSVAAEKHDQQLRLATKKALKHPAVNFTGVQARAIARGIGEYAERSNTPIWSCAILPDHVHLVVGKTRLSAEKMVIQFKGAATRKLIEEGIHPLQHRAEPGERPPKCFARGEWKVFLDPPDVPCAIEYVVFNPEKEGKPRQTWSFVVPSPYG